jgi:hypothetical protein
MRQQTGSIIYMPIDDAENNFQDRRREGVSTGVREVISVFLTETEGASAPRYGNSIIEFYSNLPEQLDLAVLSRVVNRFRIDGAVTWQDFVDQNHLWLQNLGDGQKFIGMKDPADYEYLSHQGRVKVIGELSGTSIELTDSLITEALEAADEKCGRDNHAFFGYLCTEVKNRYPRFTSRDLRNIQQAIDTRLTDFDLPEEWFDHPDQGFFAADFDLRVDMLKELRNGCMKGLSFKEIQFEESIRYFETLAGIANVERERKIDAVVENILVNEEARKRLG